MKAMRTTICLMLLALGVIQVVPGAESARARPITREAIGQEALPIFTDVTEESGIAFRHSFGDLELTNILEATGAGAAFFDYNGDGHVDLYIVNGAWNRTVNDNRGRNLHGQLSNHLFRNDGDGTFTDVTEEAGVGDLSVGFGCSAADFDADGDVDGADFLLWQRDPGVGELGDWQDNFGTVAPPQAAAASAVPEPASLALLGLGGLMLLYRRRT